MLETRSMRGTPEPNWQKNNCPVKTPTHHMATPNRYGTFTVKNKRKKEKKKSVLLIYMLV